MEQRRVDLNAVEVMWGPCELHLLTHHRGYFIPGTSLASLSTFTFIPEFGEEQVRKKPPKSRSTCKSIYPCSDRFKIMRLGSLTIQDDEMK